MTDIITTLSQLYAERQDEIESWLAARRAEAPPHLTNSVDLRHSGLKLAPVDNNLYPAGFQHLSPKARRRASAQFASAIRRTRPSAARVLIVPENHTRNLPYLENLLALRDILTQAGFGVVIGSLVDSEEMRRQQTPSGREVVREPLRKSGRTLSTESGFTPDVAVLNYDCTGGWPELLREVEQPVLPTPNLGWWWRKKSDHFAAYNSITMEFCREFGLDCWRINTCFDYADGLNFKTREGVELLADKADRLLTKLRDKYAQYGIAEDPFLYIKANSGTYGMGIMIIRSVSEILEMNKKERNKMHVVKEGLEVQDVILQEGVPTVDRVAGHTAEPMVYLVDGVPVGGMFRVNAGRDRYGNLNAAGMEYHGMCDGDEDVGNERHAVDGCDFRAYGLVASLSALAAGREAVAAFSDRNVTRECA